jgi:hypothetical protein
MNNNNGSTRLVSLPDMHQSGGINTPFAMTRGVLR